ncbi:MAG: SPOR domain-containing protein [Boseongicola sp.]|nr:SPOR domain-containing protein [Boseongicola sp.]MDE0344754.1 SPOR domain-containing protein [Boseongicola sp.]
MTAIDFEDHEESAEGGSLAAAMNLAGALLSLLLIAGLATWGWQLWVRDVTGVPVIKALSGPMRVLPEDPGGLASENQGLTVNRIAEERTDATPERLVLVSEPVVLDEDEDLAMGALPGGADVGAGVASPGDEIEVEEEVVMIGETPKFGPERANAVQEMAELSGTDLAVHEALAGIVTSASNVTGGTTGARLIPATVRLPPRRPEGLAASIAPAAEPGAGNVRSLEIQPGTRLVQFGAFGDASAAHAEWERITSRFGDYMVGKQQVVQEVETDDRTFYRLRATGFVDLADARRFCSVLQADGADCIPVVQQ